MKEKLYAVWYRGIDSPAVRQGIVPHPNPEKHPTVNFREFSLEEAVSYTKARLAEFGVRVSFLSSKEPHLIKKVEDFLRFLRRF